MHKGHRKSDAARFRHHHVIPMTPYHGGTGARTPCHGGYATMTQTQTPRRRGGIATVPRRRSLSPIQSSPSPSQQSQRSRSLSPTRMKESFSIGTPEMGSTNTTSTIEQSRPATRLVCAIKELDSWLEEVHTSKGVKVYTDQNAAFCRDIFEAQQKEEQFRAAGDLKAADLQRDAAKQIHKRVPLKSSRTFLIGDCLWVESETMKKAFSLGTCILIPLFLDPECVTLQKQIPIRLESSVLPNLLKTEQGFLFS